MTVRSKRKRSRSPSSSDGRGSGLNPGAGGGATSSGGGSAVTHPVVLPPPPIPPPPHLPDLTGGIPREIIAAFQRDILLQLRPLARELYYICPMVLKLKTQLVNGVQQALTLYEPPPQPGHNGGDDELWNDGYAGNSKNCAKKLSSDQKDKYVMSLVKLVMKATNEIHSTCYCAKLTVENPTFSIHIDKTSNKWGILDHGDWVTTGTITSGNIDGEVGLSNRCRFLAPLLKTCWHNDGLDTVRGKFIVDDITMDASFCIKRPR
jgi:hypothetical protein